MGKRTASERQKIDCFVAHFALTVTGLFGRLQQFLLVLAVSRRSKKSELLDMSSTRFTAATYELPR